MRKLNYQDEKIQELVQVLTDLNFSFTKEIDSVDVSVSSSSKKQVAHELHKLQVLYKQPALAMQYDEGNSIVSIFDQR
jgi:hypothetical protein